MKENNENRVKLAIAHQPTASNRALARELGVSEATVRRHRRRTGACEQPEPRTGLDGKKYGLRRPTVKVHDELLAHNLTACAEILNRNPQERNRLANTFRLLLHICNSKPTQK